MNNATYKKLRIGEIVQTISLTHKFDKDKLIAINTSDVYNGVMSKGTLTPVKELKGQFKKTIQKDDILFSEIRPANRRFAIVTNSDCSDFVVSTKLMVLRKFNEKVDSSYFYYCLTNQSFLYILQRRAENRIGSFPQITYDLLANYAFPIPPLEEQKRISKIIANIDRKIELNRQINDNLEAMAKQLYDYWFVQFDFPNEEGKPYKSSGGAMVWNEKLKREIPKEWMASNYTDLFTIGNGQTMPQNEGLVPAYGGNGIVKMVEISNYPACIIIGRVGANCGSIHYSKVPCWVSDNAISICSKNDDWQPFLFYSLKLYNLSKNKGGSSQPLITHEALKHLYFPMSEKHINQFCHIVNELQDLIYSNQQEILKFTRQRDELLPLLMNGQATINYHLSAY